MKKTSTLFLKIVILLMAVAALAVGIFALPAIAREAMQVGVFDLTYPVYVIIGGAYLAAIPFFTALYQAFNLLRSIDENKAFSESSVKALQRIKYSAVAITILYAIITPLFVPISRVNDAPGIVIIGIMVTSSSIVIAVFAAVLQKLVQNAIDIKSENDLTV
jgi:Protein of unknown function (DUF2975)